MMKMFTELEDNHEVVVLAFSTAWKLAEAQALVTFLETIPGVGGNVEHVANPRRGQAPWKVVIYFF